MNLYLTADKIGARTGGGAVTYHESEALKSLGPCAVMDRSRLECRGPEPWRWDECAYDITHAPSFVSGTILDGKFKIAHVYAGTFTRSVEKLQRAGAKVTYTAAAHDVHKSKQAHEELGVPFNLPHLTDPEQWRRYVGGYLAADALIVPSTHSAEVMRGFGATNSIHVIPHGCDVPSEVKPLPKAFVVGYLGSWGPDKGVRYLLEAWSKLAYKDAILLLAGRDSATDWATHLCDRFATRGGYVRKGWVENVSDFYSAISILIQPSITEGFGLEVLEALSHGRPVICSDGAGACDLITADVGYQFRAGDVDSLAKAIDLMRTDRNLLYYGQRAREHAKKFTWDKIRAEYVSLWRNLLNG